MRHMFLRARRLAGLTVTGMIVAACGPETPTGVADAPDLAKGDRPGDGTATGITPAKLGNLKLIGCTWGEAYAISSAASPLVVGMAGGCSNPYNKPFIWSAGTGTAATGKSPGHWPRAVSDNGTMVGSGPDFKPAEFDMSGIPKTMPLPAGITGGEATGITPDGLHAVGYGQMGDNSPYYALWWGRASVVSEWQARIIGKGIARGVASGGGLVAGDSSGIPVAWRRNGTAWDRLELQPAGRGEVRGITASGRVIVGARELPLARDPSIKYDEPTAWVASGGTWVARTLKGADPNFDEGTAYGVADQADGSVVAAGFAWQDTSGPGGTPWALAWRLPAGATTFNLPIKLQPLSSTWGASASAVNARGQVIGTGFTGSSRYPVMWTLR